MHTRRPREETASLGREIYERDIRRQVEAEHHGEIVAIDVDSGSWAVADGEIAAVDHLRELHPSAVNVLCERVGYRALRSFGPGLSGGSGDPRSGERRLRGGAGPIGARPGGADAHH